MVGPLDSKFDGTATITIPYNATLAPQASEVKILHSTGSSWEDVTTSPPADGHVVTGSLSSLGPVGAAKNHNNFFTFYFIQFKFSLFGYSKWVCRL